MAEVIANGLRFHTQSLTGQDSSDRGRPHAVMVHGLSVDMSSFYVTIAAGVAAAADVHLYDLRGHGRSQVPETGYAVADHLADLSTLLDAWQIDEPVHLFANSFGGIIALCFAHHYPERVASLFLVEPHLSDHGWGPGMAQAIVDFGGDPAETDRWIGGDPARARWARRNEDMLRNTSILEDLAREPDLPLSWLQEIECPVFSIYGSDSDVVSRAVARDRWIPGCRPVVVPGGTHMLLAEAGGVVRDHARRWMEEQSLARAASYG
ncbi:MAG: alpha/beta fold hydrolase [Acidimicrobiales bacterium]